MIRRIFTALFSRNPAAYFGAMTIFLSPIGNFIGLLVDTLRLSGKRKPQNLPALLFITGPPRSGTTVIYQALVQYIPCVYITNLHAVIPQLATGIIKNSLGKFDSIKNYYGYSYGWAGVNEGNKLLAELYHDGKDRKKMREKFVRFMSYMQDGNNSPVIVKNVYSYDKLKTLMEVNPEINVLQVNRKISQTAQSVLVAYKERGYFIPVPDALKGKEDTMDPYKFVAKMLAEIKRILSEQKEFVGNQRWYEVNYEDFCDSPDSYVKKILGFIGLPDLKTKPVNIGLTANNKQKLNNEEMAKLTQALANEQI